MSATCAPAARSPAAVPHRLLWLLTACVWLSAAGAAASPSSPQPAPTFNVHEYRVLGNTVLPVRDIETVLYPLLGDHKQLSDVEHARAALEKAYHAKGYGTVFVDIPPQDVTAEGIVRLRVTEGRLHERRVEGAKYFSGRQVAAALPAAQVGTVPNLPELQKELTALNSQTPDRSVAPILKQGPQPGTMDMDLKVTDKLPLHGSLEVDDNYTADTKPLRATAALSYANLFSDLDDLTVQYQDSPQSPGQVKVLNAAYALHPIWDGWRLSGIFIDSNSSVSSIGEGATGVLGTGEIYSLRASYIPFTSTTTSQSVTLGYDYKHFTNSITEGGTAAPLVTPISYSNLSLTYLGAWHVGWLEAVVSLTPDFGVRGAPNNPAAFENDRYLGRPNYFYLRYDGSFTAHLPADFRLMVRLAGQATEDPLVSNENYSIGGADGVRGYLEAEELGDAALKGTVQAQTPTWSWRARHVINAFWFYDAGRTHVLATLAGQPEYVMLRSWGTGANLLPDYWLTGTLTWAYPLTDGTYTRAHEGRILFIFRAAF
ncbi:MAG TPA: POTRA domain-containing protein [Steroidobacteraceae bacterium]|nr:POTRA domain-containing protein [Steroidobacteraceae bacterium]